VSKSDFTVEKLPISRRLTRDIVTIGRKRNTMRGLLEVDVTEARRQVRAFRTRTGDKLSFTAYFIWCVGKVLGEYKSVQAYVDWRGRLVMFDDVDIQTTIEVELDGRKTVIPHIIRAVNRKTLLEVHQDIRAAQERPRGNRQLASLVRWFPFVPWFLRRIVYWWVLKQPRLLKQHIGTAIVSSVGMFVPKGGWAIGTGSAHSCGMLLGGIARRPRYVGDRLEPREILDLAVSFNHDIVDGAPAARVTAQLIRTIEAAQGLAEARTDTVASES
jgi:pyruvate/2-oxoglutarate dehydrogenase complex dihydrolipoamide acyltransferase (E2) component